MIDVKFDPQFNNILYLLNAKQEIHVLEFKASENSCNLKAILKGEFLKASANPQQMLPIKGHLVFINPDFQEYIVFNTTEFTPESLSIYDPPFPAQLYTNKLYNDDESPSRLLFSIQKTNTVTSMMVISESSSDQTLLTIYEVMTPLKKENDILSTLRWPMYRSALPVVLALIPSQF